MSKFKQFLKTQITAVKKQPESPCFLTYDIAFSVIQYYDFLGSFYWSIDQERKNSYLVEDGCIPYAGNTPKHTAAAPRPFLPPWDISDGNVLSRQDVGQYT